MPKKPPAEPTLQEQAGLPSNWVPIEAAPIVPGSPNGPVAASGAPPSPPNMAPYFTGSIPPALQLSPDLINTQYAGPGTPSVRLMPVGAGGNPAIVAAVQSVIETSGLGQVNLTMPIQYKVSENGSNIVVTWKNVPATWALMGPPSTLQYGTPYFNVSNSYSGTSAGGVTIAFGQSLSGWASGTYAAGTLIVDSNGNVERCVIGGTTGGSAPTWPTSGIGTLTTDGGVTWAFVKYIISIGDAIVISNDVQQSGAITSITDASGNIYTNICPPQTEPTSSTQAETWMALATVNITYGSTLSVTLSWGSGQTYGTQFTTYSNVGLPTVAPSQALIASATTWSSGTVTTTVPSALLSISFCSNANNNTIASPFVIVSDDSPSGGGQICQVAFLNGSTPGAFTDHWTSSSGLTPAVVSLIALPATSTGSDQAGQPTFRAILTSDLPSSVVTSVVSDVNITGSIFDQTLTLGWSGLLSKARGGTGTATPALVAGTNITITGSWPDQTINSTAGSSGGVLVKTTNYNVASGDNGNLIELNSASSATFTLLASAPAMPWFVFIKNIGTGVLTVSRNGLTIDTKSVDLTLGQGDGTIVASDGSNYWTGQPRPVSLGVFVPGVGTNSQVVLYLTFDRSAFFPATAPNSFANAKAAATGSTTYTVSKNGTPFATIVFSASGTTGAFTQASDATFAAGDILEIDGPGTADATLANINFTFQGYRF